MINLLPPDVRRDINFARHNTQIIRYIIGCLLGFIGVLILALSGKIYLHKNIDTYKATLETNRQQQQLQKQEETLTKVKDIQNSVKLVVDVLSKDILFSKLLPQVGAIMPPGTVLENFTLSTESDQAAFEITARSKDFESASQIQVNLEDNSNKLFEKADLVDISCQSVSETTDLYPCKTTLKVLPSNNSQFLLIPNGGKHDK